MKSELRYIASLLRKKGVRYTANVVHFYTLWGLTRRYPLLIRLVNRLALYPTYIEIEVTTRCNLKCTMCEHTYWDEPSRDMSFEEFKTIVDQFPGLNWIGLSGIGESFLNKDFMKMLRYVKGRDIFVELYDSFFYIDEVVAEELIDLEVDKMFASIDSASKGTYEKIRVGADFDTVIGNVRNLLRLKREKGAYFPEIAFHYIVTRQNLEEIPQYVELVSSLTEEEKVTVQFTRMLHQFQQVKDLFTEIPEDVMRSAEEKARARGIRLVWNADVPQVKPPMTRCVEWTMPFIFVTGHVIPCCSGNEVGQRELQKATALGNVFEQSFKEIWRGEEYRGLREMLRQGEVPLPCRNCCLYEAEEG